MRAIMSCIFKLLIFLTIVHHKKCSAKFSELEELLNRQDAFLDVDKAAANEPKEVDANLLWTWQDYKAGTGVGNREELLLKSIEMWNDPKVPEDIDNWQILNYNGKIYFAGIGKSTFLMYEFDAEFKFAKLQTNITLDETIKTFKLISVPSSKTAPSSDSQIYMIFSVEINNEYYLKWFQLLDNTFVQIWIWKLGKPIQTLQYFNVNDRNKLMLLYKHETYFNEVFSPIEIYDIRLNGYLSTLQLCHQLFVPDVSNIEICSRQPDYILISLISKNNVILYEYKDEDFVMCTFKDVQNITINGLINSVCFESGYMNYLATSGVSGHLFKFEKHQFVHDEKMEKLFYEIGNVHFVQSLPLNTYRAEVMLLIQLKNSSLLTLSWQGLNSFKLMKFPNQDLEKFDLSKAAIIPNFGFLSGNTFVKFNIKLSDLPRPGESEIQKILDMKAILDNFIRKQKLINIKINSLIEETIIDNLESMKYSNGSEFKVKNLVVNGTNDFFIKFKSSNVSFEELQTNYEKSNDLINELESKLVEIENNVKSSVIKNITDINTYEINISEKFDVAGTLKVDNLSVDHLNGVPMNSLMTECRGKDNTKITGVKYFPTINYTEGNFKIKMLNGIPLQNVEFQDEYKNYSGFRFSDVTRLDVNGNLNFSKTSGLDWNELMQNLVFKNEKKVIADSTVISGEITANYILMNYLNGLKYPSNYVVKSGSEDALITGKKTFDSILVTELTNVKFINGINADEFIYIHEDQNLSHQITFENLVVEENLQIDGKIVGLPEEDIDPDLTLLNSNTVQANTKFSKIYVTGKLYVDNSINGTKWSELDDLILNDEKDVTITGKKVFLNNVHIDGGLQIDSGVINGHNTTDFITLDTEQVFPRLSKMNGSIKFEKVSNAESLTLEKGTNMTVDSMGSSTCMRNVIIFEKAPIVDGFSASYINEYVTGAELLEKFNSLLRNVHFEYLKLKKLVVEDLEPIFVNNVNYLEFKNQKISKTGYQSLSGNITISHLELENLFADSVNGRTAENLEATVMKINSLYEDVFNGKTFVESLNVTKNVLTRMINERDLNDVLDVDTIDTFILRANKFVENLVVDGLVNDLNFSKKAWDTVLKTEDYVIVNGPKTVKKLKTQHLQVDYINKHSVDDIISSRKDQILSGPIKVKGSVKVVENFKSANSINNVTFKDINALVHKFEDNMYKLTGDFVVLNDTLIEDLNVFGNVQHRDVEDFLSNLIYLKEKNVAITGSKVFNNSVNFASNITIVKSLNDLNLEAFYENAVLIDRPTLIETATIFEEDIDIEDNFSIRSFKAGSINNISFDKLTDAAVYLDRPTSVTESLRISDVVFKSNIKVDSWNDVDMGSVLTLKTYQIIPSTLICTTASVHNIEIKGYLNGENLTDIYLNTFMLSADQHITGKIIFMNNVYVKDNFISRYINSIDVTKAVSLNDDDPLIGNFVFENPIKINENLEVRGKVNGIDLHEWTSKSIKTDSETRQVIYGNWIVHGNVEFKKSVEGSGSINRKNLKTLADEISNQTTEVETYVLDKKKNLMDKCELLQVMKQKVDRMLYKFRSFEYLRVLEFDQKIVSVHHFEFNNIDYIMVNFETCYLDVYAYTNEGFIRASEIYDFGIVKRYVNLNYKGKLFFVTLGKAECGRNAGNVWVLEDYQFKHVLDLGNVSDIQSLGNDEFAVAIDHRVQEWSIKNIYENSFEPINEFSIRDKNVQFFMNDNDTLLASRESIYGLNVSATSETLEFEEYENPFGTNDILSFRAGIYEKEFMLYYEDRISSDHIFICNNDLSRRRILQTINANKPNSFFILNFEDFYETLLIFTENKRKIQIYEYKGVEGFKHHSTIKIKVDKLFNFKLRIHPQFAKKHCLAVIQENKIIILETKTYGERFDKNTEFNCNAI